MHINRTSNQAGLTLIELLVTITISTMVLGLLVSILLSTFNHSQQSQAHINLRQEGNYLITQLQQAHSQGNYYLCYEDETLHLNGEPIETLANEDINIRGTGVNQVLFEQEGSQLSSEESATCDNTLNVKKDKELNISVTLTDNYDRELDVETVIERLGDLIITTD